MNPDEGILSAQAEAKLFQMLAEAEEDVRCGRVAPIEGAFDEIRAYLKTLELEKADD